MGLAAAAPFMHINAHATSVGLAIPAFPSHFIPCNPSSFWPALLFLTGCRRRNTCERYRHPPGAHRSPVPGRRHERRQGGAPRHQAHLGENRRTDLISRTPPGAPLPHPRFGHRLRSRQRDHARAGRCDNARARGRLRGLVPLAGRRARCLHRRPTTPRPISALTSSSSIRRWTPPRSRARRTRFSKSRSATNSAPSATRSSSSRAPTTRTSTSASTRRSTASAACPTTPPSPARSSPAARGTTATARATSGAASRTSRSLRPGRTRPGPYRRRRRFAACT